MPVFLADVIYFRVAEYVSEMLNLRNELLFLAG
jgi:hypothetical protein